MRLGRKKKHKATDLRLPSPSGEVPALFHKDLLAHGNRQQHTENKGRNSLQGRKDPHDHLAAREDVLGGEYLTQSIQMSYCSKVSAPQLITDVAFDRKAFLLLPFEIRHLVF